MKSYYRVLTIAGSDSGGGAGIQADLKTFSALGCFGMSAITALTAQNTVAVTGIHPAPPEFIALQIDTVVSDIGVDAVKIGMLHSPEVIRAVAASLKKYGCTNIVLDPVMIAKSGDKLLLDDAVEALKTLLIPMATVLTPNLPEASVLLGRQVTTREQMDAACRDLASLGCSTVLLKGGHLTDDVVTDLFYDARTGEMSELAGSRVDTPNSHGTGCTISSAIAAGLAKGLPLLDSIKGAKDYISGALEAGAKIKIGHGHGPVHHFHNLWK